MNIKDMNKKPSASELRGNLVERFNLDVALENYSFNELVEMRQTLVTKINRLIESNNYDYTHTDQYQKNRLFVEILEAEIETRRPLVEGEELKAQLIVGVDELLREIKGWMQKTAEKKADEVIEFTDLVRDEMGADTSTQFADTMNGAYDALYAALEQAHSQLVIGQDIIMGKTPSAGEPMGAEEPVMDEPAPEGPGDEGAGLELDDEFGATAPAAGGDEPADRTRRESIERSRRLGAIMSEGRRK